MGAGGGDGIVDGICFGKYKAWIPEWSKGADLRSAAYASWVRTPLHAFSFIYLFYFFALLAQSGERATVNREAAGSKPARSVLFFLVIAQLVERRTVEVHMTLCHKSFPLAGCSNHPREIHRSAVVVVLLRWERARHHILEKVCSIHTGVIFLININRFKYFLCLFILVHESIV